MRFDLANNAHELSHWDDTNFYPIRVTSVTDPDGKPLTFMHRRDQLLVSLAQPTQAGQPLTLVFRGSADVIYQVTAESFGLLQAPWYPQYGYLGGRYSFHWTVRVPQGFSITGSVISGSQRKSERQPGDTGRHLSLHCGQSPGCEER